jgi:predicted PurR-regulated permease PerM
MVNSNNFQKSSLIALAGAILIISFFIIRPLLTPILSGGILAYLFYPTYLYINNRLLRTQRFSALLTLAVIMGVLLAPLAVFVTLLINNLSAMKTMIGWSIPLVVERTNALVSATPFLKQFFFNYLHFDIGSLLSSVTEVVFKLIQDIISSIPQLLFGTFLTLFITYYGIRNAAPLISFIQSCIPVSKKQTERILRKFSGLARGMIVSQLVIALIQGLLMTIACLVLQLPHVILIGFITTILAIIPLMGAIVVWIGIALFLIITQAPVWQIIFIIAYGSLLVSTIDNFVRPKILSDASQINPAIVLIGLIGGFMMFGLPGILLGPFFLALIELALEILKEVA